jgi:hypothetical protein
MRLIVPGLGAAFSVIELVHAEPAVASVTEAAVASAAEAAAETTIDEAFGKPLSQLPVDTQQTLLAHLPSSAGGLVVGPESNQDESLDLPFATM